MKKQLLVGLVIQKLHVDDHISVRQAARQIGTSPTTISRVLNGEDIDIETLVKICQWLNVSPSMILDTFSGSDSDLVLTHKIQTLISREPQIKALFIDLLDLLEKDKIDPQLIDDVLSYAFFRIEKSSQPDSKIP